MKLEKLLKERYRKYLEKSYRPEKKLSISQNSKHYIFRLNKLYEKLQNRNS